MLATTDLKYAYPSGPELSFPDITCENGTHWLILGKSGSGKTTFLHLLAGLRTPKSGTVEIKQTDISKLSASKLDHFRGANIGIIFQEPHFIKSLDVLQNVVLAQKLAGKRPDTKAANDLLVQLGIGHKIHSRISNLSVGEKQRVAIARAIINKPDVIFADEPTSALDDEHAMTVIEMLKEQAASVNAVLLIVTHDQRMKDVFEHSIELQPKTIYPNSPNTAVS